MTVTPENKQVFEVLLLDEYAKRLKVGKSTIYDWKSNGILISGRHYLQVGKVLRFIWARDLILDINKKDTISGDGETIDSSGDQKNCLSAKSRSKAKPHNPAINFEY
ncbi:hypothetical protein [Desulfobacter curvatus]|uniref:hypothetical protein n=1 Tax=Desulfobacter curvatus TaxID=2290 RepID=UPI00037AB6CE|nr:hypothetical protein [Desulfobacter curvatus]